METKVLGLPSKDIQTRLKQWGYNEIKETNTANPLKLIIKQLRGNYILYLLSFAILISFLVGETLTAYTISLVILMVIGITFIQEYRAEKAIQALKKMITPTSIVIRDSKEKEVPSRDLVPGDILILRTGEHIPADCLILQEKNLRINESILTGESKEIRKTASKNLEEAKEDNFIYMGTYVVAGKCQAQILHTGMNTRFGQIVNLISKTEKELPLQRKVNAIARYMVIAAIAISLLTGVLMLFQTTAISWETLTPILILVIALTVSAFPEGLPVVLTTTLAIGVSRMASKNAIVNRMSIIETLGETTIICTDKTGTLTRGEMTVKKIFSDNTLFDVDGAGYEAKGDFSSNGQKIDVSQEKGLQMLFRAAVSCNDAYIERTGEDEEYHTLGTPTESSLLILAAKAGIFREDLDFVRQEETPFSSERKMMSVLGSLGKEEFIFAKGAPEVILAKCNLSQEEKEKILKVNSQMTKDSFRTLALSYTNTTSQRNYSEENLTFLGLVGIDDPPREGVAEAIKVAYQAGIKVKMITGDHRETALAIASEIGLEGEILEGSDLDKITDEEMAKVISSVTIFARVRPEHKLRIVKVLKEMGEVVTMTGDGVNDAPALKEAQIGIAMGKNGTDVARSVADLTLKDDNFITIVEAIKEGRTVFNNIRKFVSYQLSCNFAELTILFLGVILAPLLGWKVPILLALQILFMNLVTDDLPAITHAFNKPSKDIMLQKPRKKSAILDPLLLRTTIFTGIIMAFLTLASYFLVFNIFHYSHETAQTVALLTLILLEIGNAFNFRSFRYQVLTRSPFINRYLAYASIISILATFLIIYSPLNLIFKTQPLHLTAWITSLAITFLFLAFFDLLKEINNHQRHLKLA
ncbi:MAG: cation-transporting P-type ATPase [bacterium]|nr:cation-transporting P-type ATPase [bacterium]